LKITFEVDEAVHLTKAFKHSEARRQYKCLRLCELAPHVGYEML